MCSFLLKIGTWEGYRLLGVGEGPQGSVGSRKQSYEGNSKNVRKQFVPLLLLEYMDHVLSSRHQLSEQIPVWSSEWFVPRTVYLIDVENKSVYVFRQSWSAPWIQDRENYLRIWNGFHKTIQFLNGSLRLSTPLQ